MVNFYETISTCAQLKSVNKIRILISSRTSRCLQVSPISIALNRTTKSRTYAEEIARANARAQLPVLVKLALCRIHIFQIQLDQSAVEFFSTSLVLFFLLCNCVQKGCANTEIIHAIL